MNALGVTLKFDAAHFLPGYNGACSRMHGHTWRVDFGFQYDHVGRSLHNIEELLKAQDFVTELWKRRGIEWND
jgi:6-pyruvoyl-tetrahydropterin synthase